MSNTKRPSTAPKHTSGPRGTDKTRKKKHDDRRISVKVDDDVYTVSPADLTGLDEARIRATTGLSLNKLIDQLHDDPGLDSLGGFMWVARMQAGDDVSYEDVLASISYASGIEFADTPEADPDPEA